MRLLTLISITVVYYPNFNLQLFIVLINFCLLSFIVKLFRLPIFNRSGSTEPCISGPTDVKHDLHVVFDQASGDFLVSYERSTIS